MDFSPIISQVVGVLWYLIPLAVLAAIVTSPLKTLESLLGLNEQQVYSVIVFVGAGTFKTEMPENVMCGGGYARYPRSSRKRSLCMGALVSTQLQEGNRWYHSIQPQQSVWIGRIILANRRRASVLH